MRRLPGFTALVLLFPFTAFAAAFLKPEPEKTFAEMKLLDAAGHPWRAAREDWEGARRRIGSDPVWADWLAKERRSVDRWMAKHHDRTEWICGWWHDFVSPKDGSHLDWTEEIPGEDVTFLHSRSDPRVAITPKILGGWIFEFRGHHAGMMANAARLYRLTDDERYATWAAAQLDFYADNYPKWPAQKNGARLYWQTLDEATNLIVYAETVRSLGSFVSAERLASWREKLFRPETELLNRTMLSIHNIATWQRCAVAQVALLFGDEAMWREALDGRFGLRAQLSEGVTGDYLWWEQSLGYNSYVVRAVLTLFTAAGLHGRADELTHEMAVTENLMLAPVYLRFPNGELPRPADTTSIPKAPDRELLGAAYRVFPTALGLQAAAAKRSWDTLLDPPPPAPPADTLPMVTSRNLESSRMALLKSGRWQVFFHYGQLTRSHAQAEALNYSAFLDGTDITHDPGTVGYGSPLHTGYYTRGLNHNVPLLNGEGGQPPQAGELLSYSASPARVSAAQPRYAKDVRASRTLAITDGNLIDTATIESTAAAPQSLGLALHVQGKVRMTGNFTPDEKFAAGRPEAFTRWRDVRRAVFHDRAEFEVDYGKGILVRLTLAVPGEFTLWHGDAPDVPPLRRECFYAETTGTSATFTTTFAPVGQP